MKNTPSTPPLGDASSAPQEIAVAVIVAPGGGQGGPEPEILAAWRDETAIRGGVWELPGGKVEPGETIEAAAAREALEELGITISTGQVICASEDHDPSLIREQHVRVHAVLATLEGPEPPQGPRTWRWIPVSELDAHPWPKANIRLNATIRARLGNT